MFEQALAAMVRIDEVETKTDSNDQEMFRLKKEIARH